MDIINGKIIIETEDDLSEIINKTLRKKQNGYIRNKGIEISR